MGLGWNGAFRRVLLVQLGLVGLVIARRLAGHRLIKNRIDTTRVGRLGVLVERVCEDNEALPHLLDCNRRVDFNHPLHGVLVREDSVLSAEVSLRQSRASLPQLGQQALRVFERNSKLCGWLNVRQRIAVLLKLHFQAELLLQRRFDMWPLVTPGLLGLTGLSCSWQGRLRHWNFRRDVG